MVFTSDYGIFWYENLLTHAGDANRDGQFDSTDLVQVFQAGEYEDDIEDKRSKLCFFLDCETVNERKP